MCQRECYKDCKRTCLHEIEFPWQKRFEIRTNPHWYETHQYQEKKEREPKSDIRNSEERREIMLEMRVVEESVRIMSST